MKQCNAGEQHGRSDWAEETQSREPTGSVMSRLSASGPHRSSLWPQLRPRESAATLLRGARACLALLAAAALLALAAPAQAQSEIWSTTLTPRNLGFNLFGCSNGVASGRCSSTTILSEDSFTYDSTDYNITALFVRPNGKFEFIVDADITTATAALTLVVGSTTLVFTEATTNHHPQEVLEQLRRLPDRRHRHHGQAHRARHPQRRPQRRPTTR